MARSLPLTIVQAAFAQSTSEAWFVLIEATHSAFATIRIVNNKASITSGGNVYAPFPFAVILPPDDEDLQVRANLIIYDAERDIIDNLRGMAGTREKIAVTLRVIAASDPDTVLQQVSGLQVENVPYQAGQLQLDLSIENFLTEGYPRDSFSPGNFPGIF